jgi:hypothetical protein
MHAEAELGARGVVVYLLPGLTSAQRKAALRRLRQEGGRGCGPRLPSGQLAVALAADQVRTAVNNTARAIRQHPVGTLVPTALAGGLLAVFVSASVSVRVAPPAGPGAGGAGVGWTAPAGVSRGEPARPPTNTAAAALGTSDWTDSAATSSALPARSAPATRAPDAAVRRRRG